MSLDVSRLPARTGNRKRAVLALHLWADQGDARDDAARIRREWGPNVAGLRVRVLAREVRADGICAQVWAVAVTATCAPPITVPLS